MGSFAAGMTGVGSALGRAEEIRRQRKLQDLEAWLKQQQIAQEAAQTDISRTYAGLAAQRMKVEEAQEKRLTQQANRPTVLKWIVSGNKLVAAGQNPDGSPYLKSLDLPNDIRNQLMSLQRLIGQAPPEIQPILNDMVWERLDAGDIAGASKKVEDVMGTVAKSRIPGQDVIREGYKSFQVDTPNGPMIVQVPDSSITRKVPAGTESGKLPSSGLTGEPDMGSMAPLVTPMVGPATDHPGAPQSSLGSVSQATTGKPNIPLPPGSRIVGIPKPSGKSGAQLKPEMEAGLRVLHTSLWGSKVAPGLDQYVGVLDSKVSRAKLIAAGVGASPNPYEWVTTKMLHGAMYTGMSDQERKYTYQLNRAISAINALRSITGLPRSTQTLMDRYAMELPNPVVTPSSEDARYQLQLVEREITTAMQSAFDPNAATPSQTPARGPVDIDSILDDVMGKKK